MFGAVHGRVRQPQSVRHTKTVVSSRVRAGTQPLSDGYGEGQGGTSRPCIRGRIQTPLAYHWQHTWTCPKLMTRYHRRKKWRQRYAPYVHRGGEDTLTSARNTSKSGGGRRTMGRSQRPPRIWSAGCVLWELYSTCGAQGRFHRSWYGLSWS